MNTDEITTRLEAFEADPNMITESIYSPSASEYDDHRLPFTEVHLGYLRKHKAVDPGSYLSNLEIMITKR